MPRIVAPFIACSLIASSGFAQDLEPVLTLDGQSFSTWQEYTSSAMFQERGLRCATERGPGNLEIAPTDCGLGSTTLDSAYDPTFTYEIPVVVHILEHSNGSGQISNALVESQIDILNQDFLAIAGSNGQNGTNARIRFYLAQVDPQGNPTNGITRTVNDAWYLDVGNYWDTLAWDTSRYLNIYTNLASGALGYVPGFPAGGIVGTNADRVVVLWSSFGLNAPIGPPFNKGRTTTHEVGHYLGLFHTFQGSCGGGDCFTSGDRICDTNPEFSPTSGCPGGRNTCGGQLAPIDNYMDYSDDLCMEQFTPQQINRMRCTLQNWRVTLPCFQARVGHRNSGPNLDIYIASTPGLGLTLNAVVNDNGSTGYDTVVFLGAQAPANLTLGNGQVALIDTSTLALVAPLPKNTPTVLSLDIPVSPSLCGRLLYTQALLTGGESGFVLTNAQDWLLGG